MVTVQPIHQNPAVPSPFAGLLAGPKPGRQVRVVSGGRERLLSVKEVAGRLGVSTATVYKLANSGELPHIRVANAIRVASEDLDSFMASHRTGGAP